MHMKLILILINNRNFWQHVYIFYRVLFFKKKKRTKGKVGNLFMTCSIHGCNGCSSPLTGKHTKSHNSPKDDSYWNDCAKNYWQIAFLAARCGWQASCNVASDIYQFQASIIKFREWQFNRQRWICHTTQNKFKIAICIISKLILIFTSET